MSTGYDVLIEAIRAIDGGLLFGANYNYHDYGQHIKLCWPRHRVAVLIDHPDPLLAPTLLLERWNVLCFTNEHIGDKPDVCAFVVKRFLDEAGDRIDPSSIDSSAHTVVVGMLARDVLNWKQRRTQYCQLAIPVHYTFRDSKTQLAHTAVTWYVVECRGTLAAVCIDRLRAGAIVRCTGRLFTRSFIDDAGDPATELCMNADGVDILFIPENE